MVTPDARRDAVVHVCQVYAVSQRRACAVLCIDRKRFLDLTFCLPFISAISVCVDLAGVSRWRLRWSFSRAMA